ncbi:hypothetical protein EXW43_00435 (plasmid) [Bacillus mycoides]|nr:hypothetical protein EXW43_00435 [Bacillus mycoides]
MWLFNSSKNSSKDNNFSFNYNKNDSKDNKFSFNHNKFGYIFYNSKYSQKIFHDLNNLRNNFI